MLYVLLMQYILCIYAYDGVWAVDVDVVRVRWLAGVKNKCFGYNMDNTIMLLKDDNTYIFI